MGEAPPLWIVADAADAARLPREAAGGRILGLTPAARAALIDAGLKSLDPRRRFGDWAQARAVAAVRRARQRVVAAVEAVPGARPIHREATLDLFHRAAYTAYRLWFTLGTDGPWQIPANGGWVAAATREAAYRALLEHMLAPFVAGQTAADAERPPLFPALYRRLRRLVLRLACRGRVTIVSGARKGMFGLFDAIAAHPTPSRIVVAQGGSGGWRDHARLLRDLWRVWRGENFVSVALLAPAEGDWREHAARIVAATADSVIGAAFGFYRPLLAWKLSRIGPALADAAEIVASASPMHYVSPDASRLSDWALAEACGTAKAERWVLCRNTHVPATSRLAEDACEGYFFARHPEGLVDRYVFWSPHGAAAARRVLPQTKWSSIHSVVAVPRAPEAESSATARRILVADTFAAFWFPHSWAFQTSDEYLDALYALIETLKHLPDTELLIRAKAKHELGADDYRRLLPASERVRVKIRDVPFRDDLEACSVLVAYRSTTIEEALHARRPVLLFGGSPRYRYLPARTTPPRPGDRAAVYAATDAGDLGPMLQAILDQHAGQPLTDAEIEPHVWPASIMKITDLANGIVGGAVRESLRAA